MVKNTTKYALYTICDNDFIEATLVMLYSFLTNNDWFDGTIIVLHDGLSYKNTLRLKALGDNILIKSIDVNKYNDIMEGTKGVTISTLKKCYYKYELFNDQKHDVVIWMDSDTLVTGSIKSLVESEFDFCWCEDKAFVGKNVYYNTGVFMFRNNEKIKNNDFYKELCDFTANIKKRTFENTSTFKGLYADQDVLNEKVKLYFTNIKVASLIEYNLPQQVDRWDIINNAKVIHYCGGDKPFSNRITNKYLAHLLWYYYYYQLNR